MEDCAWDAQAQSAQGKPIAGSSFPAGKVHIWACAQLSYFDTSRLCPIGLRKWNQEALVQALRKTSLALTLTAWKLPLEIRNLALNLLRLRGDLGNVLPISQKCLQARVTASTLHIFQRNVSLLAPWKTEGKPTERRAAAGFPHSPEWGTCT